MSVIKSNQIPLDSATLEDNAGILRQVPGTDSANNDTLSVVAANSFVTGNVIRHNGTSWVLALASTVAGARGTWMVVSATGSDFIAQRIGRITVTGHGFTPGDTLYLSSTVAGGLTATRPVGNLTLPLGFYLPVAVVEDANTLQLMGQYPQYNPVLAQYIHSGSSSSSITFSNLDFNAYGGSLEFETVVSPSANDADNTLDLMVNGVGSTYATIMNYDNLTAMDRYESTSQPNFDIAIDPSSYNANDSLFCKGTITRAAAGALSERVRVLTEYIAHSGENGFAGGVLTTGQTNITSLTFYTQNAPDGFRFVSGQGDYVKLFWRPEGI